MRTLLQPRQNKAVEDKYNRNIVYRLMHFVGAPLLAEGYECSVQSGELFYQSVYGLDSFKGCDNDQMKELSITLWYDLVNYCASKDWAPTNPQTINAVSLMSYAIARCMLLTQDSRLAYPASLIIGQIQRENPLYFRKLDLRFNRAIDVIGEGKLVSHLHNYFLSEKLLSDDIETVIDKNTIEVESSYSGRGRKKQALFQNDDGERDELRTTEERDRFLNYLHKHKLGQELFNSNPANVMMQIVTSFWLQWYTCGYVAKDPNGMAIYRFLKEDCKREFDVTDRAFANCIRDMINEKKVNQEHNSEIAFLFEAIRHL